MKVNRLVSVAATAALALGVAACGSSSNSGSSNSANASASSGGSSGSSASSSSLPTVTMMVGGIDKQIYMEYKLADQLGYFKKYGVNMQLSTEQQGGVGAETAMVNGSVDMAGAWYIHTAEFQALGKSVVDLINLGVAPGEREMCAYGSGVHSTKDWKGKTLGVTDLGSGTDGLTKYLATKAGLNPATDIHRLAVGAGPTAVAALQQKSAQCVMTTQPTVAQLEAKHIGYSMLDLASGTATQQLLGGEYPAAGVLVTTSWLSSHEKEAQDVVTALEATLHWMHTHSAAQIADAMPASYTTEGVTKAQYISSLAADKSQFAANGLMPANAPQTAIAIDRAAGVIAPGKQINVASTYTNKYVQAADKQLGLS